MVVGLRAGREEGVRSVGPESVLLTALGLIAGWLAAWKAE